MVALQVLALPNSDKPFIAETDASDLANGAVLLQLGNNSLKHPVAFYSRKMLLAKTNCPVHLKKCQLSSLPFRNGTHHIIYSCTLLSSNQITNFWNTQIPLKTKPETILLA